MIGACHQVFGLQLWTLRIWPSSAQLGAAKMPPNNWKIRGWGNYATTICLWLTFLICLFFLKNMKIYKILSVSVVFWCFWENVLWKPSFDNVILGVEKKTCWRSQHTIVRFPSLISLPSLPRSCRRSTASDWQNSPRRRALPFATKLPSSTRA